MNMTIRQRFSDFVESLQEPRRKFGAVCFLLVFLFADFLLGGIYFLSGYFSLKTIGPAAEMAAEISELYQISVYVDTSEYLWWCIPFFALAILTAVFAVRYIVTQKRRFAHAERPTRVKERIHAKENAVVAVRVHTVDPATAPEEDLRHEPPAWLLDPLAVVSPKAQEEKKKAEEKRRQEAREQAQERYTYSDFVYPPNSVSAPLNQIQDPLRKKERPIPYAGSLQYIPREKKDKKSSPYDPK